ncbi:MAG: TOBE domain-containing protein, partial [Paraburkholderia graminis]
DAHQQAKSPLTLGIRPEFVRLAHEGEAGAVRVEVLRAQQLGNYQLVTAQCDGHLFNAKLEPHVRVVNGPAWLRVAAPETVFICNDERIDARNAEGAAQ